MLFENNRCRRKVSQEPQRDDAVPCESTTQSVDQCKNADESTLQDLGVDAVLFCCNNAHLHVVLDAVQCHLGSDDVHDLVREHHDGKPQQVEQREGGKGHRGSEGVALEGEGAKGGQGHQDGPPAKHDGVEDLVEGCLPNHLQLGLTQLVDAVNVRLLPGIQLDGLDTCTTKNQFVKNLFVFFVNTCFVPS